MAGSLGRNPSTMSKKRTTHIPVDTRNLRGYAEMNHRLAQANHLYRQGEAFAQETGSLRFLAKQMSRLVKRGLAVPIGTMREWFGS